MRLPRQLSAERGATSVFAQSCPAAAAALVRPSSLDAEVRAVLPRRASPAGSSRRSDRLGRPIDPAWPTSAGCSGSTTSAACTRQHLRRLPLADRRVRRHPVDRHRHPEQRRRRPASHRPAQPAPHADGDQHRLLSRADVERALRRAVGRPVRQPQGFLFPAPEGDDRSRPAIRVVTTCCRPGPHPADRAVEVAGFTGLAARSGPLRSVRRRPRLARAAARRSGSATSRSGRRCSAGSTPRRPTARSSARCSRACAAASRSLHMFGRAIAEFEFTLTFADAPDRPVRARRPRAMTAAQKHGALLFFGKAGCVRVPRRRRAIERDVQRLPEPRRSACRRSRRPSASALGNMIFDGPGADEDFGLEQVTGDPADRYKFRTSPLRNVALQPAFFHNGAFTRLEDAIRHHLDVSSRRGATTRARPASTATCANAPRADRAGAGSNRSAAGRAHRSHACGGLPARGVRR